MNSNKFKYCIKRNKAGAFIHKNMPTVKPIAAFVRQYTVYTRVQVDSSISRIEILKSLFGPKFETLV